jgi:hypothetical protein
MAISSSSKLTKYISATTIVTADVANSWFGGLYGSAEGNALDPLDPRVAGHVHDGEKSDGHAGKIDLVSHVTGKLRHANLEDSAVYKNNVGKFLTQGNAIPEYEVVDGDTYYYLDLSSVYDAISSSSSPFEEGTNNAIRQTNTEYSVDGLDFVVGSSDLDDLADPFGAGDERLFFDKSKAAFRAGSVDGDQWDDLNRGNFSAALGRNNTASGTHTFVAGSENLVTGNYSASLGLDNQVQGQYNIAVGTENSIQNNGSSGPTPSSANSSFASGSSNQIRSPFCAAIGGENLITDEAFYSEAFGRSNYVSSPYSIALGYEAKTSLHGEFAQSSGSFSDTGDAQASQYVLRFEGPEASFDFSDGVMTADGLFAGPNFPIEQDCAYIVEAHVICKTEGRDIGASFILKSTVFGPQTTSASSAVIYPGSKETLYITPSLGGADAQLNLSSGELQVRVKTTGSPTPRYTKWVATVKITKLKY